MKDAVDAIGGLAIIAGVVLACVGLGIEIANSHGSIASKVFFFGALGLAFGFFVTLFNR